MQIKKSWIDYFRRENLTDQISSLIEKCYSREEQVFPKREDILKIFSLIDFDKVKVIIIGQDPYPGEGFANGIAFSANKDSKRPASLNNIFKELSNDLDITRENNDLSDWVEQGVFLINSSLTVIRNDAGSDLKIGWEPIIIKIIQDLYKQNNKIVFCLWGNFAQSVFEKTNIVTNHVIKSYHPSPLGYRGFKDSKPFSKINNLLIENGIDPINW